MNLLQRVKRYLAEAPKAISYAVGTSGKNNYFSPQTRNKSILEKYRTIYRQGGIPAQAIDCYALFMLSPGIILVSDNEAAKDEVEAKLSEMDIERLLWLAITRSLNFGDSFQEIVRFKVGGGISRVVHRSPISFSIVSDDRGDLKGYEQETELGTKIPLPVENIVHLALIPDDDLYGISLTGRAFDDVIRDTKTCDGIATGIERHGTGKHHWVLGNAEQTVTADDIKSWKDKLQTLKADSDIVTSHLFQCVDLDRGGIPNAQQYSDVFLQRLCAAYGVPGELLGLRIGTTDATAVTRIDAFFRQIQTFQTVVARTYQPIVDQIVGQPGIVKLTFGDASPKDEKQRAEWITMLMNANKLDPFWVGEQWLREQFDLPEVEESAAPLPRESSCHECGGPGSGNFGHAGIPGQRGGSAKGSGGIAKSQYMDDEIVRESVFRDADRSAENKNGSTIDDYEYENPDLSDRAGAANYIYDYAKRKYEEHNYGRPDREQHWAVVGDLDDPDGIGYIWHDPGDDHVYIEAIASLDVTKPGTGVRVINYAKKLAKEKGLKQIQLEYTPDSKAYYQKKGWRLDERTYRAYYDIK